MALSFVRRISAYSTIVDGSDLVLSPKVRRLIEKTIGVGGGAPQDYKPKEINAERTNIVADKEPENDYDGR